MSNLIKFPTQIEPSRITQTLTRKDETFGEFGQQQVASRGMAHWVWTYEFRDLSLSEREIVESFLAKCKGAVNTFKVSDPANYELKGDISSWTDVYSGRGNFEPTNVGSTVNKVNSYFSHSSFMHHHVTDEGLLRFEWRTRTSVANLAAWVSTTFQRVDSLQAGAAYVQRLKHFQSPNRHVHSMSFRVGSGSESYLIQSGPGTTTVKSTDSLTCPFYLADGVDSIAVGVVDWRTDDTVLGDYFHYADYRLERCGLIANSENLFTRSNEFDHADWVHVNATTTSGGEFSARGIADGAWKMFVGVHTNSVCQIRQTIAKPTTEDIYTVSIYAKAAELSDVRLYFDNGGVANGTCGAIFRLNSGTVTNVVQTNSWHRIHAKIWDVGSDWYRCQLTAQVTSNDSLRTVIWATSGTSTAFNGNGSDGIWIADAQKVKFPFMGPYLVTSDTAVTATYYTGDHLVVDGFDPEELIKANTRLEVVTQYHSDLDNQYEKTEFKKVVEEVRVHREGWAIVPIDPPLRNAPTTMRSYAQQDHSGETHHNAVIFDRPEMKSRLVGNTIQIIEKPLQMTDVIFEVAEDLTE